MTLDETIKRLQELREQVGGDADIGWVQGGYVVRPFGLRAAAVGKSEKSKVVSRGGIPVVMFTR